MVRAEIDRYLALQRRAFWGFLYNIDSTTGFGYAPTCAAMKDANGNEIGTCMDPEPLAEKSFGSYFDALRPTFDARADATVLLYSFGKIESARDLAAAGERAARELGASELGKLGVQIKTAYYGIQLGDALVEMIGDARRRLEKEVTKREEDLAGEEGDWEARDRAGVDAPAEETGEPDDPREEQLAQLGGYLAEARALEARARAGLRTASEGLRIATGYPPQQPVQPVSLQLEPVLDDLPPLAEVTALAQQRNPLILAATAGVAAAQAELDRAQADLFPTLALQAGVRGNFTATGGCLVDDPRKTVCSAPQSFYPFALVALKWNLNYIDLFHRRSEAEAKLTKARAQLEGARLLGELAVSQAYGTVQEKLELLTARKQGESWARRGRTAAASRCGGLDVVEDGEGQGAQCDEEKLARALKTWLEARAARLTATFELNVAVANLSAATGTPLGRDLLPPGPPATR
jgi:outer membrane protein TolC